MKPNDSLITITDNLEQIIKFLSEMILSPRLNAIKWSHITKQTPNIKIGYPGQHLASLITGMEGERTGARGNDLVDGTEVKSCSRIDQLDQCVKCKNPVSRLELKCSVCGSEDIIRKNDSKWLFSIRSESELNFLIKEVDRVLLLIADYPHFEQLDFDTLRFQVFEIWPKSERNSRFAELMTNYYHKIYLAHKEKDSSSNPAPKNFWPYSYQFYLCNPIPIFSCIIKESTKNPTIEINNFVEPSTDRSKLPSEPMPISLLSDSELSTLKSKTGDSKLDSLKTLDENLKSYLPLRDTDRISTAKELYVRRRRILKET